MEAQLQSRLAACFKCISELENSLVGVKLSLKEFANDCQARPEVSLRQPPRVTDAGLQMCCSTPREDDGGEVILRLNAEEGIITAVEDTDVSRYETTSQLDTVEGLPQKRCTDHALSIKPVESFTDDGEDTCSRYWTIDPDSRFMMYWNLVGLVCVIYQGLAIPFQFAFNVAPVFLGTFWFLASATDVYFLVDVPMTALTGFKDLSGTVVRDVRRTVKRYCKGWLMLDMLASIPWEWIPKDGGNLRFTKGFQIAKVTRVMKCMRLLRLLREEFIPPKLQIAIESNPSFAFCFGIGNVLLLIFTVTHIFACVWYMVGHDSSQDDNWIHGLPAGLTPTSAWEAYLSAFYFTLTTMTTVGYGDITVANYKEICFVLVLLLLASIVFSYLMGTLVGLLDDFQSGNNALAKKKLMLSQYLTYRSVPDRLWQRLRSHLLLVWEANGDLEAFEQELKKSLTPVLRRELCHHVYGKLLCQAPFLGWMHGVETCVMELATRVSGAFLSSGDCLFRLDSPNTIVHIIMTGSVRTTRNEHVTFSYKHMSDLGHFEVPRRVKHKVQAPPPSNRRGVFEKYGEDSFHTASAALLLQDLSLHRASRSVQKAWRKRRLRQIGAHHHHLDTLVDAPAYFGESCLLMPLAEWDSKPPLFSYTAYCVAPCECVLVPRAEVKQVIEIFSPWLCDRFEVFRKVALTAAAPSTRYQSKGKVAVPAVPSVEPSTKESLRFPLLMRGGRVMDS